MIVVWIAHFQIVIVIVPHAIQQILHIQYSNLISFSQLMGFAKVVATIVIIRHQMVLFICANVKKNFFFLYWYVIILLLLFYF